MDDGKFGIILNSRKANVDAYNAELRRNAGRGLGRGERTWALIGIVVAVVFVGSITWRACSGSESAPEAATGPALLTPVAPGITFATIDLGAVIPAKDSDVEPGYRYAIRQPQVVEGSANATHIVGVWFSEEAGSGGKRVAFQYAGVLDDDPRAYRLELPNGEVISPIGSGSDEGTAHLGGSSTPTGYIQFPFPSYEALRGHVRLTMGPERPDEVPARTIDRAAVERDLAAAVEALPFRVRLPKDLPAGAVLVHVSGAFGPGPRQLDVTFASLTASGAVDLRQPLVHVYQDNLGTSKPSLYESEPVEIAGQTWELTRIEWPQPPAGTLVSFEVTRVFEDGIRVGLSTRVVTNEAAAMDVLERAAASLE